MVKANDSQAHIYSQKLSVNYVLFHEGVSIPYIPVISEVPGKLKVSFEVTSAGVFVFIFEEENLGFILWYFGLIPIPVLGNNS